MFGKRFRAKARPRHATDGSMNKLEARYAQFLTLRVQAGELGRFDFDQVKLRLAPSTFYSPDFRVILVDGTEEYHEVKGHWEDDARVKIKCAAVLHDCYVFRSMVWDGKQKCWVIEEVPAA